MGKVESEMLEYIKSRLEAGALSVPGPEVLDAIIPTDQQELRQRPAYRHGLDRLRRRNILDSVSDPAGIQHYFIGKLSVALYESLGMECPYSRDALESL